MVVQIMLKRLGIILLSISRLYPGTSCAWTWVLAGHLHSNRFQRFQCKCNPRSPFFRSTPNQAALNYHIDYNQIICGQHSWPAFVQHIVGQNLVRIPLVNFGACLEPPISNTHYFPPCNSNAPINALAPYPYVITSRNSKNTSNPQHTSPF